MAEPQPSAVPAEEPIANRTLFYSFRQAALDMFGPSGLAEIGALMTKECRQACIEPTIIEKPMLPERYLLEWYEGAYAGPCKRSMETYALLVDRMLDIGFSRVHRFLLGLATPPLLAKRAAGLWRHDHSTGELRHVRTGNKEVVIELVDHVFCDTPLARKTIAEVYRYCVTLTNVKDVTEQHALVSGRRALEVVIRWR